jgi:hypothetical protein
MLERYFIRPTTVDRIRACWIGDAIERYVTWLAEQGYAARNVAFRVPVLMRFGEFAKTSGAINWNELPGYVEPFVEHWLREENVSMAMIANQPVESLPGRFVIPSSSCSISSFPIIRTKDGLTDWSIHSSTAHPVSLSFFGEIEACANLRLFSISITYAARSAISGRAVLSHSLICHRQRSRR